MTDARTTEPAPETGSTGETGETGFVYVLRYTADPATYDRAEEQRLIDFVTAARIDDVTLFVSPQEMNLGHTTAEEIEPYLELFARVRAAVRPAGVSGSLNPWHTLMHADAGRRLREGQEFALMVDPWGREASACVCPRDRSWQEYLAALYGRLAAAHPRFLWVEDDFRLHNHAPLDWGGCFCSDHLRRFSAALGGPVGREQFYRRLLAPGPPTAARQAWLSEGRESLLAVAGRLGETVAEESPETSLGLMSSYPHVHAAEGRDWAALTTRLAAGNAPVMRPHLPAYVETRPADYLTLFNAVTLSAVALAPAETEHYPELENFPYSRYAKSLRFTRFQLMGLLALRPAGVMLNLFDMNGNGIVPGEGYHRVLADTKPFIEAVLAAGWGSGASLGVQVLISQDSSATLWTREGASMSELYPREAFFASLLSALGIPVAYRTDRAVQDEIVAVSGQYFRNLSTAELNRLLDGNLVLVDGVAADTLVSMAEGRRRGLERVDWALLDDGRVSYERSLIAAGPVTSRPEARMSVMGMGSDAALVDYRPGRAALLSELMGPDGTMTGPGLSVVGERLVVYPFTYGPEFPLLPPMLLTTARAELLRSVLRRGGQPLPMVVDRPQLHVYAYRHDETIDLLLVNASLDDHEDIRLDLQGADVVGCQAITPYRTYLHPVATGSVGGDVVVECGVRSMEAAFVRLTTSVQC